MTIEHEALPHDLYDLYPRAGHEVVHPDTGRPYWPHYYHHGRNGRGGLTHADDGTVESLVAFLGEHGLHGDHGCRACSRCAGRPDLLVETLVLDRSKPYHRLFDADTLADAKRNLNALKSVEGGER